MTRYLLDVASYQGSLRLEDVVRAGFGVVNLKISHGLGQKSVHTEVASWVKGARERNLGISTFHYLTKEASGAEQASYALSKLQALGLMTNSAHQVDCEADASWEQLRDYVWTMQGALGRPVVVYTGDWWWTSASRNWDGRSLTPYLWAAPNAGYLGSYPGDTSNHWNAGYGGWTTLSIMQYAVAPLYFPDGTQGTIDVSKSAIRDEVVWRTLAGEGEGGGEDDMAWTNIPAALALRDEFNALNPIRDKSSDGSIGDAAHAGSPSDHNPDETGNTGGVEDSDSVNEVHALDIDASGPWPNGLTMEKMVQHLLGECRVGRERRLRYVIFNKRIWGTHNGWKQEAYTGSNPHDKHAHFSFVYGSGAGSSNLENVTTPYGLLTLGEDMSFETDQVPRNYPSTATDKTATGPWALGSARDLAQESRDRLKVVQTDLTTLKTQLTSMQTALIAAVNAVAAKDQVDEAALAAAIAPALAAAVREELSEVTDQVSSEEVEAAFDRVMRRAFGSGSSEEGPTT
jgi:Glycosyl hydrolases family 25